jgi:hypothetical protein
MLHRQLGNISIYRIIESEEPNCDPLAFFPQTTPGGVAAAQAMAPPPRGESAPGVPHPDDAVLSGANAASHHPSH